MSRWFTSDLHLGDPWAAKLRYCKGDFDKMAVTLGQRWDSRIRDDDDVYIVGDVFLKGWSIGQVSEWLAARPGTKHVILGNQDREEFIQLLPVAGITHQMDLQFEGFWATLSHFPETRAWDDVLIHGHTHRRMKWHTSGDQVQVHVGWEAWRRPVHESEIEKVVRSAREILAVESKEH
jgi:calcineurin-like phosphoesterase family protein